ncbi:50S ribosomal protein L10 [Geminocystis sp. GBBB08]|uniref:50S ribosomal protein L10 n=1 Tax=Geminocystis sp. GBBB08 TaxID=2604140 RepID=UPI0027E262E3|nr:50S ribosomal protein L10 [Geminocystis sp. GBBB08]MBL1211214.1 50S ribosomal protein L10 [Geminocystis sp. GBBB08]
MSKSLESKKQEVAEIKELLEKSQLAFVVDYQGLTVADITDLRNRLREGGNICKVTKNTLMSKAVEGNEKWEAINPYLKGTSAFVLADEENIGSAVRAYQAFQKERKKSELRGGVMEGQALSEAQVKALADLPTKEQLIAQIAGSINAITAKIARGINEVPTSLARAIDAVKSQKEEAA